MARFGLAVAVLCLTASGVAGEGGLRLNTKSNNSTVARRRAATYSELSTIVPDPDCLPTSDEKKEELAAKYGRWHFWDGEEDDRDEQEDICVDYPSCDIPGDEFDEMQWQADAVYVNHILNDADQLVGRAMEAIFEEYGYPKPSTAEGLAERMKMFHWDKIDLSTTTEPPEQFRGKVPRGNGGWTTKRSFNGLVRRLLHAMMTTSTFNVVLAGHSSAAGHGNHFRQGYIMTFHRIMAPIFARLGVKLVTRNMSQGGMGTLQNALASSSLYSDEIDLLLWDSGMTEKMYKSHIDIFFRQGLIAGKRVPVIWSAGNNFELLKMLHEEADVDVGEYGSGWDGIPFTESEEQVKTLPWAVQYLKCDPDHQDVCKNHNDYCTKCWVPRDDGVKPKAEQLEHMGGQVSWHPGWRQHQLQGRVIAFSVLEALQQAVQQFSEGTMGGPPLADDYWHINDYYENIRTKVKNLDPALGYCHEVKGDLPERVCTTPIKGFSQYTPRFNFDQTSLASIVKPSKDGYVPHNDKVALYEGPDAHNSCYDIPDGEVDVLAIVSGRRRNLHELPFFPFNVSKSELDKMQPPHWKARKTLAKQPLEADNQQHRSLSDIQPGRGWELVGEPQGYCDGSYYAICKRDTDDECILGGHHDSRASLIGNAYSGWIVFNVPAVKEGIIMIKVHSWARSEDNHITADWSSENNERRLDKDPAAGYPDNFKFEYAIDGKVTTLNKDEYIEKRKRVQRVVEILTLMDDENFSGEKDVEVAIRLQGCAKDCAIGITHLYYA